MGERQKSLGERLRAKKPIFYLTLVLACFVLVKRSQHDLPRTDSSPRGSESPNKEIVEINRSPQAEGLSTPCQSIYRIVCQKPGITRDPTGYVHPDLDGEKQAVQVYKDIIHKHRDWSIEQVAEELAQQIYDPKHRARIMSAYAWVKRTMEHMIDQQPGTIFTAAEKNQIKERLHKTQLQVPPPASIYADEPDILTRNEVYYERLSNGQRRMRVGGAYIFVAKSWFNLIFTLAHELAHSIDPCEIRADRLSFPAYDYITACFLQNNFITLSKSRSECGANDQLSEIFADWMATQVTVVALKTFSSEFDKDQIRRSASNAVRDLCEQGNDATELDMLLHPSPQTRIGIIFGGHPEIRRFYGCEVPPSSFHYCKFEPVKPRGSL